MKKSLNKTPRLFISYHKKQRPWVKKNLVPLLEAAGGKVLIDYKESKAIKRIPGQMDALQERADITLCLLEPTYCATEYCMHELNHALSLQDSNHSVIPVIRRTGSISQCLGEFNAIRKVDLSDPKNDTQWQLLFDSCGLKFKMNASEWLRERNRKKR